MSQSGYIGYQRSVRSDTAIRDYEVPLSMITKELVRHFLDDSDSLVESDKETLKKLTVSQWKCAAKIVEPASWHHTSKYFNKTDHYCLTEIAERILENPLQFEAAFKENKKKEAAKPIYGIICVQVWGGSRNHPKLIGYDTQPGIVINDWLYYRQTPTKLSRYKINANKTEWIKLFDSYKELVAKYPEYSEQESALDAIIKEKGL